MMNLMHWKLLIAVADAENVSRAASKVGLTQSGASQAISQVEDALGVKIFIRDRRKTTTTAIGMQIIDKARKMIAELESIQNLVDASKGYHMGKVSIASFPSVFTSLLPPLIQNFKKRHPSVDIISLAATDEEVEDWLSNNYIDVGVVLNPSPERDPVMLGYDAWVAAVPANHHLARRGSSNTIALSELSDEPFIVTTGGCHLHGRSLIEGEGLSLTNIRLEVKDWRTAFTLIGEGIGVSIVPASTLPEEPYNMRIYPLSSPFYRCFGLVCSEQGKNSPATQAFLDQIRHSTLGIKIPVQINAAEMSPV
ncbi:LysR family transcriptional regulator [Photobacterium sp. TY1-4]|uniref:LysR family transcriptional regulator n=1 Tax=Photobacterium sp. TY1-4 TaxID=2899122 RepID=UPI0021BFB5A3|nr:LysR family transcriptional regulator [Photobacterium sp. TY1-4]UXI03676.1 LysR family transcriptional regulator [Photobacterium sp. TY1-4]